MSRTRIALGLALAAGALAAAAAGLAPSRARASVPGGTPVFSSPTDFDNPLFPFEPGALRIAAGKDHGARSLIVDSFLATTRDFSWNGGTVTCRVLRETNFEDGALVEDTENYFAEADDGTVYYFGEIVNEYEDGVLAGHGGSWVVGTPGGGDPPGTQSTANPGLFMPFNPEVGDEFMPENVPDGPQELDRVLRTGLRVRTGAGTFEGCIEVLETNVADGDTERKWYAPGVGVLNGKTAGESFRLQATTLSTADPE
jgi:hypothetical protein